MLGEGYESLERTAGSPSSNGWERGVGGVRASFYSRRPTDSLSSTSVNASRFTFK
jgi:hypothetical protein